MHQYHESHNGCGTKKSKAMTGFLKERSGRIPKLSEEQKTILSDYENVKGRRGAGRGRIALTFSSFIPVVYFGLMDIIR